MTRHVHVYLHRTRDGLVATTIGTAVRAARKLNEIHRRASAKTGDAFEEGKHPRGEGGKFEPMQSQAPTVESHKHFELQGKKHAHRIAQSSMHGPFRHKEHAASYAKGMGISLRKVRSRPAGYTVEE